MVRDKVQDKVIRLFFTPTHTQLADLFTKAISSHQLRFLISKMNVLNIHSSESHLEGEYQVDMSQNQKKQKLENKKKGDKSKTTIQIQES